MPPVSVLAKLRALLAREAPEQAAVIREGLRGTAATGREHSVVGAATQGGPSRLTMGEEGSVVPNRRDLMRAIGEGADVPIVDFHTHPGEGYSVFEAAPSRQDFSFYAKNYPLVGTRDLRTLIAVPPSRDGVRRSTSYNYFTTRDPRRVFDPAALDAARFELQRAGSKGAFRSVQDDPLFRDYFDYGGDLGDLLGDASPLALLKYREAQGLGRHELELGGKQLTPARGSTDAELFKRIQNPATEILRSKKFARGGLAQLKECSCHG